MQIKIALIDDNKLFREGLKRILVLSKNIRVVMEADDSNMLAEYQFSNGPQPDICIISSGAVMLNNNQALKNIKKKFIKIKVLVLPLYFHEFMIAKMYRDGADGYLLKNTDADKLREAINVLHIKNSYWEEVPPELIELSKTFFKQYFSISTMQSRFLSLCVTNLSYKEIGEKMGVSPRTVEGYRDILFQKFKITTRSELVLAAIQNGLIEIK